ncbi:phage holin [Lentibacillus juripiscarius]|uniref:Phage holin n=1 Tax=Lentibacillus juripiscarius TaxID=257446 RepID=A0ABW5V8J6_9BACI
MDKGTIVRSSVLLLALVNQFLVILGKSPLPIDGETMEQLVSLLFTVVSSMWAWFKNNYITGRGMKQKEVLRKNGLLAGEKAQNQESGSHY